MKWLKYVVVNSVLIVFLMISSCGPVVFTARLNNPPPPWFYPNRIETVRYVYFPDHLVYYDLSLSTYLYFDNNIWIRATQLPVRFNNINLRRSRTIRINNYFGDNIPQYHREHRSNDNRRNSNNSRRKN